MVAYPKLISHLLLIELTYRNSLMYVYTMWQEAHKHFIFRITFGFSASFQTIYSRVGILKWALMGLTIEV